MVGGGSVDAKVISGGKVMNYWNSVVTISTLDFKKDKLNGARGLVFLITDFLRGRWIVFVFLLKELAFHIIHPMFVKLPLYFFLNFSRFR